MINAKQYVPHGTNTMGNGKIMELVAEHGMEGYGIYWMLMEHLQQQHGNLSSIKIMRILGKNMGVSYQKIDSILRNFGLFRIEHDRVMASAQREHEQGIEGAQIGKPLKTNTQQKQYSSASYNNNITVTDNNINNNSSSNSRIKIQGWEQSVNDLAHEQAWCELMAMRSGMKERFMEQYPTIIQCFKDHIRSYGKEDTIHSLSDAKNYFSNYISPGSTTHTKLMAQLNKTKENDPYRYEDISPEGKRSYCGLPIPDDAPPRPGSNALWNGRKWE